MGSIIPAHWRKASLTVLHTSLKSYSTEHLSISFLNQNHRVLLKKITPHLLLTSLCLSWDNIMTLVLADGADSADTHLVGTAKKLQALLVLRADLSVQVPQFVHQFVSLESSRLIVGLQVFLTVRGQAVEAGLDSFELLSRAEVARHVSRSSNAPVAWRHQVEVQASLLDLLSHFGEGCIGSEHGSLGESDSALRTDVNPGVVSLIPVATNAVHTEAVATGDSHRVPQETCAQVAAEVIWRHGLSHVHLTHAQPRTQTRCVQAPA